MADQTETQLWVDNTESLYNRKRYMQCNLFLKHQKGVFDPERAKQMFRHLTDEAAKTYKKEIGEPLTIEDRREAERDFVQEFQAIVKDPVEVKDLKASCVRMGRRERVFRNGGI